MSKNNETISNFKKTIQELKNQLSTLDEQYFQFKNLIEEFPGNNYWKDKNGIWIGLNKRCAQSLKRMGFIKKGIEEEVIGKTDSELFNQKTAAAYRKNDLEVMKNKIELNREEAMQLAS